MDALTRLFKHDQQRVFTPPADFSYRVMQRLAQQRPEPETVWDNVLAVGRPLLAAALAGAIMLVGIGTLLPVAPDRGLTQIYLEWELNPAERLLYVEADIPPVPVVLTQIISVEEQ
jgi:hypothetical protein